MMQIHDHCALCKGKLEHTSYVEEYYPGHSAHTQCIEDKSCVFCGISSMCVKCQHKDCNRTFHYHCFQRYFSDSHNAHALLCDLHRKVKGKRKEYQRLWLSRQISHRAGNSPSIIRSIKDSQGDNRHSSICSGQVFWYAIGSQFFPNFITLSIPELAVQLQVTYEDSWNSDIDNYIEEISSQYTSLIAQTHSLLSEALPYPYPQIESCKDYREEEVILAETRNLKLREGFEEYLQYFETKVKEETDANTTTEKRTSSLREVPKNEEDFVCSICGDGDYEDDDLIVICSTCEMGAHMKCYGIPMVPESDWHCHGCTYTSSKEERFGLRCALCPIRGGCIKPTNHRTTHNLAFPNYPEGRNELVWCHIFCAVHLDMSVFSNKENLTGINLKNIDPRRFTLRCQVCKTKDGACLQCQHGRCQAAFHPECGKDYFTNTRDKTGYDEVRIYCPLHKPLKLRRVLEGREKKCVEDIVSFCRAFERYEKKSKNPTVSVPAKRHAPSERPFTHKEKMMVIKAAEKEIRKLERNNTGEFSWVIRMKSTSLRSNIEVSKPQPYNLLDPLAFLQNKITISGRKFTECQKFYASSLYILLKQELIVMGAEVCTYVPVGKKGLAAFEKEMRKIKDKSHKKKIREIPITKKIVKKVIEDDNVHSLLMEDVMTTDVYCICRKPFVEKSLKKSWESEMDFTIRQAESQMIQCEGCDEWFHYKCIGLKYDSPVPESYKCDMCNATNT